jgi:hypothetical protein
MTLARATRITLVTGALVAAAALAIAAPRAEAALDGPDVPPTIAVEDGHKVFLVGHATGVQIYRCGVDATGYTWGLVAPRATLTDDRGRFLATHFGGPTWQVKDGSYAVGSKVDGVTMDATAIPWLLIRATSSSAGSDGDQLTNTSFIQRTATTGGLPPAARACDADSTGEIVEVPYTADYHFWKPTGS